MDPALLREHQAFTKRALSLPTVERRPKKEDVVIAKSTSQPLKKRPAQSGSFSFKVSQDPDYYKSMKASSSYKFSILAKIVSHMRSRHKQGDSYPLNLEEILDETQQVELPVRVRQWLQTEAMVNNPKLEVLEEDGQTKFKFKPPLPCKDSKSLRRLLEKYDMRGKGGILYDDVEESVPKVEKVMRLLGDSVVTVQRSGDKKKVLFYNDKSCDLCVSDEVIRLWRSATVDALDEGYITEYLEKHGLTSMQDSRPKTAQPKLKKKSSRRTNVKVTNEHLKDVLVDYQ